MALEIVIDDYDDDEDDDDDKAVSKFTGMPRTGHLVIFGDC